jgi:hypothetical protein
MSTNGRRLPIEKHRMMRQHFPQKLKFDSKVEEFRPPTAEPLPQVAGSSLLPQPQALLCACLLRRRPQPSGIRVGVP